MWLRNYYNILTALMLADDTLSSTTQPSDYTPPIMVRMANGSWSSCRASKTLTAGNAVQYFTPFLISPFIKQGSVGGGVTLLTSQYIMNQTSATGIAFGTGNTPVTYEDYQLESIITSGLTLVSSSGSLTQPTAYDNTNHHISSERSFTVNNSSGSSITISEFGIFIPYEVGGTCCLAYREVLDNPVTLAQSESVVISFKKDAEVYNYTPY